MLDGHEEGRRTVRSGGIRVTRPRASHRGHHPGSRRPGSRRQRAAKKRGTTAVALLAPAASMARSSCAWRPKTIVSLFGVIVVLLSYYRCRHCGVSQKPWDKALGLTDNSLTPAAAQVVSQAGVLASFAEASQRTLRTMSGLSISESTVERTIEDTGRRVKERLDAGQTQGPRQSWAWQRDAQGRTCAYVSLDHTGVRQHGPAVPRFPRSQDFLGPRLRLGPHCLPGSACKVAHAPEVRPA